MEDVEPIITLERQEEHLQSINNHLKKLFLKKITHYYALHYELNEEIREYILNLCQKEDLLAEYMSTEELKSCLEINKQHNAKELEKTL